MSPWCGLAAAHEPVLSRSLDVKNHCDPKGFIHTGREVDLATWPIPRPPMSFETSIPGVFAAGDVRLGSVKRVASSVGEGAGAVHDVHQYIEEMSTPRVLATVAA